MIKNFSDTYRHYNFNKSEVFDCAKYIIELHGDINRIICSHIDMEQILLDFGSLGYFSICFCKLIKGNPNIFIFNRREIFDKKERMGIAYVSNFLNKYLNNKK